MDEVDLNSDVVYQLTKHADHLNSIDTPSPSARVFYEVMSGALVWSDETSPTKPSGMTSGLRFLFAYRTKLLLTNSEPDLEFWHQCVALFPNWIGFLPERRQATPELLAEYRRGDVSLRWCLRRAEREMNDE